MGSQSVKAITSQEERIFFISQLLNDATALEVINCILLKEIEKL